MAGWDSTTLRSAQTARRLLRQEQVSQQLRPVQRRNDADHLYTSIFAYFVRAKARTVFMKPNTLIRDPTSRQTLIDKNNDCVINSGRGAPVRGSDPS